MKVTMGKKAEMMYSNSPTIKKSDKTGNIVVKRPSDLTTPPADTTPIDDNNKENK